MQRKANRPLNKASAAKKPTRLLRTDGEATYNRILDTAGELFATVGFAETTSKMIAARAEVDLASINYHFVNRNGLYQAVLVEAHSRLVSVETLRELDAGHVPPRIRLRMLIEGMVERASADRGWHAKVLARECLSPTSHLQTLINTEIPIKVPFLLSMLSEITGIAPDDPELLRCLISVMAPCAMLLVIGPGVSPFADQVHSMPASSLVDHLYDFAIGGLEAIGRRNAERISTGSVGPIPGENA